MAKLIHSSEEREAADKPSEPATRVAASDNKKEAENEDELDELVVTKQESDEWAISIAQSGAVEADDFDKADAYDETSAD